MGKVRAKVKAKEKRRARELKRDSATVIMFKKMKFVAEPAAPPIIPMNARQAEYLSHLRTHPQVFVLGPAGTGKTWIAASHAADLYRSGSIGKIVLTRPNVPCGRSLGFFPGTLESKFAPWTVPVTDAIRDRLGKAVYDIAVKNGDIEVVPFEVMRGRSWRDAFILLDEAQNTSVTEIKMFLTRVGEGCTTVINGDIAQCDVAQGSGLHAAITLVRQRNLPVPIIEFSADDIVRSGLCAMWFRAFEEKAEPALTS